MKYLHDLKDKLCEELEKVSKKRDMSAGDLEMAHKLTDTIKNIDKIMMLEEDDGYSQAGNWNANIRGNYGDNASYRGRKRDSMGRYSRADDDYSMRRGYSRDGYSMGDDLMEQLEEKMRHAKSDRERDAIRRVLDVMREG